MPYVENKEPLESKLNWLGILTAITATLTGILNSEWIAANPKLSAYIMAAIGILTVIIRTFFTHGPTTLTKLAVLLAITLALSTSPAHARPVRVCDGTACRVTEEPTLAKKQARWFKAMPLPVIERNFIRILFGR
jgi:hypothetical protein